MKKEKRGYKKENIKAYFIIVNLIVATFAFSWLVNADLTDQDTSEVRNAAQKAMDANSHSPTGTPTSKHFFGLVEVTKGEWADAALSGVKWAGIAFLAGQLIGSLAGMESEETQALSTALAGGSFTSKKGVSL